jgi:hypothetical protein
VRVFFGIFFLTQKMTFSTQKMEIFSIYFSSALASSSTSSTPCSSLYRFSDCSLTVPSQDTTFLFLLSILVFLRTRLSWTRTVFSTVGCFNLFMCLLCIHPVMIHTYSHPEELVITEHNFLVNHSKLSNKVSTWIRDVFHGRLHPTLMRPLYTTLSEGTCILVKLVLIMEIMLFPSDTIFYDLDQFQFRHCHDPWAKMPCPWGNKHCVCVQFYRNVKGIPPHHEQDMYLLSYRFVQVINGWLTRKTLHPRHDMFYHWEITFLHTIFLTPHWANLHYTTLTTSDGHVCVCKVSWIWLRYHNT